MGNLVMAGLNNFPGQISNEERQFVAGIMPKLTQTPQGREQIIQMLERLSDRPIEYRKTMTDFMKNNDSSLMPEGKDTFYDKWDKYKEENPLFEGLSMFQKPEDEVGLPTPETLDDYNAIPSGAEYIDPEDNKKYRKP